ncbi:C1q-like domain-containing protein [Sutcliffiella rhizosphaerae]|uniref:C1q domain-containing protein n=1 Tax=Sutcliffiella rhizosphaerae TaxID=2880967 RepID=A0ABN8ABF2_9BACI|nr:hypothetical protein [Sutcliffiella rhizosphaerae]CAG9620348.1 hypothetical protein BACCIP111883_01116 [Sutcliffiella rhizosphaerae]
MKYYYYKNDVAAARCRKPHKDCKDITINVDCGKKRDKDETVAFRAVKETNQTVQANVPVKITFEEEQFDFGNIYNNTTSTFVPRESGVYYVASSFTFSPNNNVGYRTRVDIVVNGTTVAADNDFWNLPNVLNIVHVSAVLNLQAGDLVEIFGQSTTSGTIVSDFEAISTSFEAFKVS